MKASLILDGSMTIVEEYQEILLMGKLVVDFLNLLQDWPRGISVAVNIPIDDRDFGKPIMVSTLEKAFEFLSLSVKIKFSAREAKYNNVHVLIPEWGINFRRAILLAASLWLARL